MRSGTTLRNRQHSPGSLANRSLPTSSSCCATVCSGATFTTWMSYTDSTASRVPMVSAK
ncbi:Uncharacterised protein [Mycobacteroides abscessus subsp. abscessus]|nr:Uncharacterised protein [Mycobacteroides abscessus subsp. abscessus]SKW57925.1 Uncharacterised protein [Mycobacteroides abscessus subsp. abscessus]